MLGGIQANGFGVMRNGFAEILGPKGLVPESVSITERKRIELEKKDAYVVRRKRNRPVSQQERAQ